jgi:uncharacterized protein
VALRSRRAVIGRGMAAALLVASVHIPPASAQAAAEAARERADFAAWLASAPTSPLAAIAQQPIGTGLRLGPPDADVPLAGVSEHRLVQLGGAVRLEGGDGGRTVPRGIPVRLGRFTLVADGPAGRTVLTVFGPHASAKRPAYFDPNPALVYLGPLSPPARPGAVRVLGIDGIEVEAAEAGSVIVPVGRERVRLRVLRLPTAGGEESELEIFFRDGSNGRGTYPAGRFVSLIPTGDGRYRLDFNRARNPFCAYSSAYPCPAPWPGNTISSPVTAGERYEGADSAAATPKPQ